MHTLKPRNPLAHSAIMRKGGAHQRSHSSARFAGKQAMLAELDDWQDDMYAVPLDDEQTQGTAEEKPGCGPVFSWQRPLRPTLRLTASNAGRSYCPRYRQSAR